MIYLGEFKAGDPVFYVANFHNDAGSVEDPSAVAAQHRAPDGTWTDLAGPAKQNAKVGHYGGTVDTSGFAVGQHTIRMDGTVTTGKAVATEFSFLLVANTAADIHARLGAPAGAAISDDIAAIKNDTAAILTDTAEIGAAGAGLTALASAANLAAAIAYIDTEVQAILDIVADAAHGNAGLKTDLDALLGRLTALRAGYLDNLSVGAVALETTLSAMKGATFNGATDSLEAIRDRGDVAWITGGGGEGSTIMVLPFSGSVQASYAQEGLVAEIIQGDAISIPYDLAKDLTGWNVLFAAKASLSDAGYAIAVKDITASLTDVLNGRGLIPLASAETGLTPGSYIAEIEIRKGVEAITAMRFILKVKKQVIS